MNNKVRDYILKKGVTWFKWLPPALIEQIHDEGWIRWDWVDHWEYITYNDAGQLVIYFVRTRKEFEQIQEVIKEELNGSQTH